MKTIVVGIDGSRESVAALRFAVREARLRGGDVRAVAAWQVPASAYGGGLNPNAPDPLDFEAAAEARLAEALAATDVDDVPVEAVVREGDPVHVLLSESADAEQLVVGCHELGRLRALFHHSVSGGCAHDARCPVTVVHAD